MMFITKKNTLGGKAKTKNERKTNVVKNACGPRSARQRTKKSIYIFLFFALLINENLRSEVSQKSYVQLPSTGCPYKVACYF